MLGRVSQWLLHLLKKEDGLAAVEYGVMLALIVVVCLMAIMAIGTNANKTYTSAGNAARVGSSSSST